MALSLHPMRVSYLLPILLNRFGCFSLKSSSPSHQNIHSLDRRKNGLHTTPHKRLRHGRDQLILGRDSEELNSPRGQTQTHRSRCHLG